jgi:hypothetical protein
LNIAVANALHRFEYVVQSATLAFSGALKEGRSHLRATRET